MKGSHVRSRDLVSGRNVLQGHDLHDVFGVDDGTGVGVAAVVQHGRLQVQRVHILEGHLRQDLGGPDRELIA